MTTPISPVATKPATTITRSLVPRIPVPQSVRARLAQRSMLFPMAHPYLELPLVGLIILGYLYNHGNSERKGETPDSYFKDTVKIGTEALITSTLIENFRGVQPALTLGKMVYDLGRAENNSQRTEAVIRNSAMGITSYAGIYLGRAVSDFLHRLDALRVVSLLENGAGPLLKHTVDSDLGKALLNLKSAAKRYGEAEFNHVGIKELTKAFENSQQAALEQISKLPKDAFNSLGSTISGHYKDLARELKLSRAVAPLRILNPAFGYILGLALVGIPLARIITKSFERTGVIHKGTADRQDDKPLAWLPFFTGAGSNSHQTPVDPSDM